MSEWVTDSKHKVTMENQVKSVPVEKSKWLT